MNPILYLLLITTAGAYAQLPTSAIRQDSLPAVSPPDDMPVLRSRNSFYRRQSDPKNVVRATLDNMPVHVPDTAVYYTMLRSPQTYQRLIEPPRRFLKPMPRILPGRP